MAKDPSRASKVKYCLVEVLIIGLGPVIACAESWDEIALYGHSKLF